MSSRSLTFGGGVLEEDSSFLLKGPGPEREGHLLAGGDFVELSWPLGELSGFCTSILEMLLPASAMMEMRWQRNSDVEGRCGESGSVWKHMPHELVNCCI